MIFKFKEYGKGDFTELDHTYKKWISRKFPNFIEVYPYLVYSILDLNFYYDENILYLKKQIYDTYIKEIYEEQLDYINNVKNTLPVDSDLKITAGVFDEYYTAYDLAYCSLRRLTKKIFNYNKISDLKKEIKYYHPYTKKNNKDTKHLFNYNKNIFPVHFIIEKENIYYGFTFDCIVDTYIQTTDIQFSLSQLKNKIHLDTNKKLGNIQKYNMNSYDYFETLIETNWKLVVNFIQNLIINSANIKTKNRIKEFKLFLITGWNNAGEPDTELGNEYNIITRHLGKTIDEQHRVNCHEVKDVYIQNLSNLKERGFNLTHLEWTKVEHIPYSFYLKGKFNNTQTMNMLIFHIEKSNNDYIFKGNWSSEFRMLSTQDKK